MKRKCDRCDNEATVHEVQIRGNKAVEKHLCETCAKEVGISAQPQPPISELITKFAIAHGVPIAAVKSGECASCGLSFAEFRQSGLLGCPECYKAFEPQLAPLITRAHEGGTHHIGKTPKNATGIEQRKERIIALRKQLSEAIAAEQYEQAARLRDQLSGVEKPAPEMPRSARPERGA